MTAALLFLAAIVAGAIASLAGFGIGSVLTPLLALSVGAKEAVIAVSIPHLVATAIRLWALHRNVDLRVLRNFGIPARPAVWWERCSDRALAVLCWRTFWER